MAGGLGGASPVQSGHGSQLGAGPSSPAMGCGLDPTAARARTVAGLDERKVRGRRSARR
ncbi:hypothetical protein SLNWT_2780 [Streptomyces albus]|uniref:Uncharacterized protein n=1 Tax=Streptomyces albus (strain ATCC 21838 / DSM 41398 / FERM P-419 / JCM 4703 / NBRC 107858) TaxID=1081613 RepID=A0A0B5EWU7_STRA4|nr:hypothetical protein SLNWT_2780 [Streptomyces albus]AOU77467.1 hypothetical protein SLNHY_2776 [Streptomyces albus]AYN33240.1 hypothetical protein DUI70_2739 [Streptomyces albus]